MKNKLIVLTGLSLTILLGAVLPRALLAYDEIVVKDGGTIRGTVKMEGKVPKLPPVYITKAKEVCRKVPNETLIVGSGQGLRYAVVTLEGITKGIAIEKESAHELDNLGCRFVPHVSAASSGQFFAAQEFGPDPSYGSCFFPGRSAPV